jgi:hypothetical protein
MGEDSFSTCSLLYLRHREGSHGYNAKKEIAGMKVVVHLIKLELRGLLYKSHTRGLFSLSFRRRPRRNLCLPPALLRSTSSPVCALPV